MNKSFMLLDKSNNLQKNATVVVKFNFEQKDYLVYSIEENESNSQIFVSRLVMNSDGKYFLDNILPEEKGKLNNIVYNIVILIPTEAQKGVGFEVLSSSLLEKFATKLMNDIPTLEMQEYYNNCSVAITSKFLVETAVKFYSDNLSSIVAEPVVTVPTWTAPASVTTPVDVNDNKPVDNNVVASTANVTVPATESNTVSTVVPVASEVPSAISEPVAVVSPVVSTPPVAPVQEVPVVATPVTPNPQLEKLAVVSDPSLGIGVTQPNLGKNKEAGFANTKYIVIGTVCLVLAITTVVVAYILITNMK